MNKEEIFKKYKWLINYYANMAFISVNAGIEREDLNQVFYEQFARTLKHVEDKNLYYLFEDDGKGFKSFLDTSLKNQYADILRSRDNFDLTRWGAFKSSWAEPIKRYRTYKMQKCSYWIDRNAQCPINESSICQYEKVDSNKCQTWKSAAITRTYEVQMEDGITDNSTKDNEFLIELRDFCRKNCNDLERKYIELVLNFGENLFDSDVCQELNLSTYQFDCLRESLKTKMKGVIL